MVLKDNAGLIQRYAFSNVENYSLTVQAPTVEEALALYLQEVGLSSDSIETDDVDTNDIDTSQVQSTTGTITFLVTAEIDGDTYFYFTLAEDSNLYMSSIKNSNRQVLLQIGTTVTIEFAPTAEENTQEVVKIAF